MISLIDLMDAVRLYPLTIDQTLSVVTWWFSAYFMAVGVYLIFIAEERVPIHGFGFAMLGATIYLAIRIPDWFPPRITRDVLALIALFFIAGMGIQLTRLLWKDQDLQSPIDRCRDIYAGVRVRF